MFVRLFLVRHGETVDNVAGIIAGVRDSALTSHGFQQARRLGNYLNASGIDVTHIFASPLQRAATTAEQVWLTQPEHIKKIVSVVPTPLIQEQDFGLYEGVTYGEYRASDDRHATVETALKMAARADLFIEQYLAPILDSKTSATVVVVSHGRMLQVLWTQILHYFKPEIVKCDRQLLVDTSSLDYTRIGAWSNTGYLEATFSRQKIVDSSQASGLSVADGAKSVPSAMPSQSPVRSMEWTKWQATVSAINGRHHLNGLVRTKGGVGSSKYDAQQGTLDKFFTSRRPTG